MIDHIDRNPKNNQRSNVCEVTGTDKKANMGTRKSNTTGFIGVQKRKGKFCAKIRFQGEVIDVAAFNLDKTAAVVRDKAVELMRGQYGVYNFPDMKKDHITWPKMQNFIDKYVEKDAYSSMNTKLLNSKSELNLQNK